MAAFIGAPHSCSGGVGASQDPCVYYSAFIHSKAHLLFSCSVTPFYSHIPHALLMLTVMYAFSFLPLHRTFLSTPVKGLCYWTPITTKSDHLLLTFASSLLCDVCPCEKLSLCLCSLRFLRPSGKICKLSFFNTNLPSAQRDL